MSTPNSPTLITIPTELRGARVVLRPYRADDVEQLFADVDESREHVQPWVNWVDKMATVDGTRDYCIRCAARWLLRSDLSVGIFDISSGEYLGRTGLHEPNWALRSFEIGYWVRVSAMGHGYVTEAVQLLIALAFNQLDAQRIALQCNPGNKASRRVAELAGFVFEERLRNIVPGLDGDLEDRLVFSLIPADRER